MGQQKPTFEPLEPQQAQELEFTLNEAAKQGQVLVIDPDRGIVGRQSPSLVSPSANVNGLIRFGRHFGNAFR